LEYKILHDPEYADLRIDQDALNQKNGSVADRLPVCQEGRQDSAAAMPVGHMQRMTWGMWTVGLLWGVSLSWGIQRDRKFRETGSSAVAPGCQRGSPWSTLSAN